MRRYQSAPSPRPMPVDAADLECSTRDDSLLGAAKDAVAADMSKSVAKCLQVRSGLPLAVDCPSQC